MMPNFVHHCDKYLMNKYLKCTAFCKKVRMLWYYRNRSFGRDGRLGSRGSRELSHVIEGSQQWHGNEQISVLSSGNSSDVIQIDNDS